MFSRLKKAIGAEDGLRATVKSAVAERLGRPGAAPVVSAHPARVAPASPAPPEMPPVVATQAAVASVSVVATTPSVVDSPLAAASAPSVAPPTPVATLAPTAAPAVTSAPPEAPTAHVATPPAPVSLAAAAAAAAAKGSTKLLHADMGSTDLDHYIARAKANNRDVGAIRGGVGINRAEDGSPYWGPVDNESSRAKAAGHLLAIDQWECISCGTCVEQTDKVFYLPADAKATPIAQDGPMDLIQDAIEACPVTCIHWVDEEDAASRGLATGNEAGAVRPS